MVVSEPAFTVNVVATGSADNLIANGALLDERNADRGA
jgi:hypothetical protein